MIDFEECFGFMHSHVLYPPTERDLDLRGHRRPRGPRKSLKCYADDAEPYIPRPRNPFILFRVITWHRFVQSGFTAEKDHRHLSKIAGLLWKKLTPQEKRPWLALYELEKRRHARMYPDYRYKPMQREKPAKKRATQRNGPAEQARNETFVELVYSGHDVPVLDTFVREFDKRRASAVGAAAATGKPPSLRRKRAPPLPKTRSSRSRKSAADRASSTETDESYTLSPIATPIKPEPSLEWEFVNTTSPVPQHSTDPMSPPLSPLSSLSPSPQPTPSPATPPSSDFTAFQAARDVAMSGGAHMFPSAPYYLPTIESTWADFQITAAADSYSYVDGMSGPAFGVNSFGPYQNAVDPAAPGDTGVDFGEFLNFDMFDASASLPPSAPSMGSASMLFRHSH